MEDRILIASRDGCAGIGGLASYQRGLSATLQAAGYGTVFCAMHADGDRIPPHEILDQERSEPRKLWMRLASRQWLHPLLEALTLQRFASGVDRLAQTRWRAVHFVGTGWDAMGFAMHALARKCGATFTVWPAVHPGIWGDDAIDLRLYRLADTVFCQSRHEVRHLASLGLPEAQTVVSGLPPMCRPDGDGPALRARLGIGDRPAVLFLGRRDEGKGYPALLAAWPEIVRQHPGAVLLLAGPAEPDEEAVPDLPADSFRDLGVPDEKAKADAYDACDIFCLPSAHESFGIVFVEAWSYGKPVICGTAPATREWVRDGINGRWATWEAPVLSARILELLADPGLGRRLGSAGRDFQRSALTWESVVGIHLKAFGLASPPYA